MWGLSDQKTGEERAPLNLEATSESFQELSDSNNFYLSPMPPVSNSKVEQTPYRRCFKQGRVSFEFSSHALGTRKKNIPPSDCLVTRLDCRKLRNPHKDPNLKEKTGRDKEVQRYIKRNPEYVTLWNQVEKLISSHKTGLLQVEFYCVGGNHRSLAMVEIAINYVIHLWTNKTRD